MEAPIPIPEGPTFWVSPRVEALPRVVDALRRFAGVVISDDAKDVGAHDAHVVAVGEAPLRLPFHGGVGYLLVAGPSSSETHHRVAIAMGAAAFIHGDMDLGELTAVWTCVVAGYYPLPRNTAHLVASRVEQPPPTIDLTDGDRIMLAGLAHGDTMADIARRVGHSERHARRLAGSMWRRFGVANRAQGLVAAARWGLVILSSASTSMQDWSGPGHIPNEWDCRDDG